MGNIYSYNDDFSWNTVMGKISDIEAELDEEQSKPTALRDGKREFRLLYRQFIEGLKLSTGFIIR